MCVQVQVCANDNDKGIDCLRIHAKVSKVVVVGQPLGGFHTQPRIDHIVCVCVCVIHLNDTHSSRSNLIDRLRSIGSSQKVEDIR